VSRKCRVDAARRFLYDVSRMNHECDAGRLAQRLERPVYTRKVAGSNPALPTTYAARNGTVVKIVVGRLPLRS
jgi:hypothetical protein